MTAPSTEGVALVAQAKLDTGPVAAWHSATAVTHQCRDLGRRIQSRRESALQDRSLGSRPRQQYRQAISLDPGYSEPQFNLGVLELHRKDGAAAAATATELLDKNPDNLPARLLRVQANLMLGHHDEALADLEEAVKRDPKSGDAWAALGELRERLQRGDAPRGLLRGQEAGRQDRRREGGPDGSYGPGLLHHLVEIDRRELKVGLLLHDLLQRLAGLLAMRLRSIWFSAAE